MTALRSADESRRCAARTRLAVAACGDAAPVYRRRPAVAPSAPPRPRPRARASRARARALGPGWARRPRRRRRLVLSPSPSTPPSGRHALNAARPQMLGRALALARAELAAAGARAEASGAARARAPAGDRARRSPPPPRRTTTRAPRRRAAGRARPPPPRPRVHDRARRRVRARSRARARTAAAPARRRRNAARAGAPTRTPGSRHSRVAHPRSGTSATRRAQLAPREAAAPALPNPDSRSRAVELGRAAALWREASTAPGGATGRATLGGESAGG